MFPEKKKIMQNYFLPYILFVFLYIPLYTVDCVGYNCKLDNCCSGKLYLTLYKHIGCSVFVSEIDEKETGKLIDEKKLLNFFPYCSCSYCRCCCFFIQ